MTDLERLFRQLVANLKAEDPARLRRPVTLADIRDSILPYRANRRALQIESSEDYEIALMRLCAGEAGLATTEPEEARAEFASELASPNPDLAAIQRHKKAVLTINPNALARAAVTDPELAFAPPAAVEEPVIPRRRSKPAATSRPVESGPVRCKRCGNDLPTGRVVNFCPQCGENLTRRRCPQCNTELEAQWRHCVSCGTTLTSR